MVTFGIAAAFKNSLLTALQETDYFSVCFDEAFNSVLEYDKKVQEVLKKSDLKVLAQAVALKNKGTSMRDDEIVEQMKVVKDLEAQLVQNFSK